MSQQRPTFRALAALLPTGVMGLSMSLASADARATAASTSGTSDQSSPSVAYRLEAVRRSVSVVIRMPMAGGPQEEAGDDGTPLAWWGNGWHNGGWRNGGWHNGGWHNGGWHNGGWGNGGWHNGGWGNGGWHNGGWGNGWHNW